MLGWSRYAGQSVDELLALASASEVGQFLHWMIGAVVDKRQRAGINGLSSEERVFFAVVCLDADVNNGGYDQYFFNSYGENVDIIVDSLHRIGCHSRADITQTAVDALGLKELNPLAIQLTMSRGNEIRESIHYECSDLYYACKEDLNNRLFEFVRVNKSAFKLP